jgi:hypothetical protein
MYSDPAIASQKLQANLLAIQNWFKKWRMKANESKSIHVTFTIWRETCPLVHMNNVQLPHEDDIKYLGLHLDRRLTWHKHIFAKRKQLESLWPKDIGYSNESQNSVQATNFSYMKQYSNQSGLTEYNSGYGFHFRCRNSRMFPIESLAHDSGCTLVCAEYCYLKGSPNTNSWIRNLPLQLQFIL